jgi:hypothetical protein
MNTEYQIKYLGDLAEKNPCGLAWDMREAIRAGRDAIRAQQERENPKPLSLAELKERVGKPVYVVSWDVIHVEGWNIYYGPSRFDKSKHILVFSDASDKYSPEYGKTWIAYDHEPKEAGAVKDCSMCVRSKEATCTVEECAAIGKKA